MSRCYSEERFVRYCGSDKPRPAGVRVQPIVLLGLHFIANHFIAKGGLRDFADVVAYLRNPIILVLEVLFLVCVTSIALLGVRAILVDLGLSERAEKRVSQALAMVGVLTVAYGLWVTWAVIR